ncbi:ferritin-like domain-containing protein [Luteibacter aegosomatissinici]|uniref:YciE/YciF ferroxidase family protein n=1 Tax=Luteibacter aegosomatissinici TaxID=2911539 RepID=UPI001FFB04CC|nr:ferritin-like domain-containing protein [Luteibacter aegosomatissinici]UPG96564.1 ferritin-like domain-containing protein [Luteibacter aegosomatissinici]
MPHIRLIDLYARELSQVLSAEQQMSRALPRMADAASVGELRAAFEDHQKETLNQVQRLERILELSTVKPERVKCTAMEGLIADCQDLVEQIPEGPVRDAALISVAQKIEHFEIAAYGTLIAVADIVGADHETAVLLAETLDEEKAANEKLTTIALTRVNEDARAA